MTRRSDRGSVLPILMMGFGLLLILGAGAWYISVFSSSPAEEVRTIAEPEEVYPEIPRVSIGDAKAAYDNGVAVFIDVRNAEDYAVSHIPGALSIPLEELPGRMNELEASAWIIPY